MVKQVERTEQKMFAKNIFFIIVCMLVVIAALYFIGVLDDERKELSYKTDVVCLMGGYFDGTAELLLKGTLDDGSRIYWFNCSENTVKIRYDSEVNVGYVIRLKKGR